MTARYSVGFDFGTESVRAIVADIKDGRIAGQSSSAYKHGVIDVELPEGNVPLPPDYALQHPQDWLDGASIACREAMKLPGASPDQVVGIGVAFTSCTMLPAFADGTPLCLFERFGRVPLAYPKLWKHHAAKAETDRINEVARERNEPWLARYGGTIGLEWFFPKMLETLECAPGVYDATEVWLEAGDWFVWQLVGGAAAVLQGVPVTTQDLDDLAAEDRIVANPIGVAGASVISKKEDRVSILDSFDHAEVLVEALDQLGAGIPVGDPPVRIQHVDRVVANSFDQHPKALLAFAQGLFRSAPGAPGNPLRCARRTAQRPRHLHRHRPVTAIFVGGDFRR
mgnify:CR=1 FL=1